MTTEWEWIVPFKGRNHSGSVEQNFLCRAGNVYVMDNHRAALWCWLKELDLTRPHSLIHIDRHTDTLQGELATCVQHLPAWATGIEGYLTATYDSGGIQCPVIRWDNYLSIYLQQFGENLGTLRFLTHEDGDAPNFKGTLFSQPWDLPTNLSYWLEQPTSPWIVNIDLDYFFCGEEDGFVSMFSDDYLNVFGDGLRESVERGRVGALTLCLTPDSFTPGWAATEDLAKRLLDMLGLRFELPRP